ncbi:Hint domain-containing protein [Sedimentitalea sp. HM32M-2]|uniref:Hint domain-containing protein n=1 Tax=Sedimentitalea sp. HM32M-2 TaxID=3351566 RepID=UPI00362C992A
MPDSNGNTDVKGPVTSTIDPNSNNPTSVSQTSTVGTEDNGGIDDDGFEVSVDLQAGNVNEQVNLVVAIDTSGSTANSSGSDVDGDGTVDTYLEAQIFAAKQLFQAYLDAGYDPGEVTISLVDYDSDADHFGPFTLDAAGRAGFDAALNGMTPGGLTNFQAGLEAADDAFTDAGADPSDNNVLVFMSDGFPVPRGQDIQGAAQDLENNWNASISGIGVGQFSSLGALNQLDNTGGATKVRDVDDLVNEVVAPLTQAELECVELVIEGLDDLGQPFTQTIKITPDDLDPDTGDPYIQKNPSGWFIDCFPVDPAFDAGQDVKITVNSYFAEDPGDPGSGQQVITTQHNLSVVICFTPGTGIRTPDGIVAVENLSVGDPVVTRDHGVQRIRWIGVSQVSAARTAADVHLRPVLIRAGALGPNRPAADLRVSRQHRILIDDWRAEMMFGAEDGVLVPAFALCNDQSVTVDHTPGPVTYYHIAFDRHEVIYAEGVEAESFFPVARTVSALRPALRRELYTLFPELRQSGRAFDAARTQPANRVARVLAQV